MDGSAGFFTNYQAWWLKHHPQHQPQIQAQQHQPQQQQQQQQHQQQQPYQNPNILYSQQQHSQYYQQPLHPQQTFAGQAPGHSVPYPLGQTLVPALSYPRDPSPSYLSGTASGYIPEQTSRPAPYVTPFPSHAPGHAPGPAPYVSPFPPLPLPPIPFDNTRIDYGAPPSGPVIHDGFVPAPGHEDDDHGIDTAYPTLPRKFHDSLFQNQDSDSEDDEEDTADEEAEDERMFASIADANDREEDADFSISDAEDEFSLDDDLDDDDLLEEEEEEEEGDEGNDNLVEDDEVNPRPRKGRKRTDPAGLTHRVAWDERRGLGKTPAKKQKKEQKERRTVADPGPQFKAMQRKANHAYVEKRFEEAIEYAHKAIQMNPEIFATHSLLAEVYLEMGQEDKSLEAMIIGAPTKRDKQLWYHILETLWKLDQRKYPNYTRKNKIAIALNCLRAISNLDPDDYDARSQKLEIELELGNMSKAISLCRRMLEMHPNDSHILREMARMTTSSAKLTRVHLPKIIKTFDHSIEHFLKEDSPDDSDLDWSLLNIYAELLERAGDYDKALAQLRRVVRWIQGRQAETYWDEHDDDREFDLDDHPRRVSTPGFVQGAFPPECYGEGVPLEIQIKLGLHRLRCSCPNLPEALHHFGLLEPKAKGDDSRVLDYPDLFREVGDALSTAGHWEEALRFYDALLNENSEEMSAKSYIGLHSCYKGLERTEKAEECMNTLLKCQPDGIEDLVLMAKYFEDLGMEEEARRWGDAAYRNGGSRLLQKSGFKGFTEAQFRWWDDLRRMRAAEKPVRRARNTVRLKPLAIAPATRSDSGSDEREGVEPARGPLAPHPKVPFTARHRHGGPRPAKPREMEVEALSLEGTEVPLGSVDDMYMRSLLDRLATELPEELAEARLVDREVRASFHIIEDVSERADEGDPLATNTWMELAKELIDEFSSFQLFYYDQAQQFTGYFRRLRGGDFWKDSAVTGLATYANNVEDQGDDAKMLSLREVPEDFHNIPFDKWLDIFCQYAVLSARQGNAEQCFATLDRVYEANVFYHSQEYLHRSYLCRLACGIMLDDSRQVSVTVRWLMKQYPFASDIFRLYNHANRLCSIGSDYNTQTVQKTLLRLIKAMDHALLTPQQRRDFKFSLREKATWDSKFTSEGFQKYIHGHDPVLLSLFAHVLMTGGTYISALNYYFRAFAINPEDPVLNLSIAVCYLQHAMKRQSENRQYQLQQGLSFAGRYYDLRTKDGVAVHVQEAEFNMGRLWHMVGLTHLAIPAYERCIALKQEVEMEKGREDFSAEAAYAMQTILALAGDFRGARRVTEKCLIIE
ncbi:TPR-like protein [Delitschia confertaspora ATCC 74209]|uniref:TPR-like protein n=1 Tax=Delitschia confertaspora ATCC 74209 TaxID=1513339 RepID=A0A9P4MZH6_9PLEO|nr:TPR-like protein [Delitschia confertaspora ATCC 74209]